MIKVKQFVRSTFSPTLNAANCEIVNLLNFMLVVCSLRMDRNYSLIYVREKVGMFIFGGERRMWRLEKK